LNDYQTSHPISASQDAWYNPHNREEVITELTWSWQFYFFIITAIPLTVLIMYELYQLGFFLYKLYNATLKQQPVAADAKEVEPMVASEEAEPQPEATTPTPATSV
jgi:hypothetical protein